MERYQVIDECCHSVGFEDRRLDAFVWASRLYVEGHGSPLVYDRMAHHGAYQLWSFNGDPIERRP